jgi:hypothetical protein
VYLKEPPLDVNPAAPTTPAKKDHLDQVIKTVHWEEFSDRAEALEATGGEAEANGGQEAMAEEGLEAPTRASAERLSQKRRPIQRRLTRRAATARIGSRDLSGVWGKQC